MWVGVVLPQFFLTGGYLGATALKKASTDRIKELLRILNYLAAPIVSAEDLLLTSGVNGVDYTLDAKGNPVLTKQGNSDANYTPWKYVTQHPAVIYTPDIPNYAKTLSDAEHTLIPYGVSDPMSAWSRQPRSRRGRRSCSLSPTAVLTSLSAAGQSQIGTALCATTSRAAASRSEPNS